jgi:hypothetical protein
LLAAVEEEVGSVSDEIDWVDILKVLHYWPNVSDFLWMF